MAQHFGKIGLNTAAPLVLALLLAVALAPAVPAQRIKADEPTAFSPNTRPAKPEAPQSAGMRIFSAICWYLPNRILDVTDIPAIYLSAGDGNGISLRATKFLAASWIHNDVLAIGWAKRPASIPFGISYDERYFGFLAAQAGKMINDPTQIGFSGHLVVLGANIGVSLGELLDAVTGVVGVDLMGDDHGPTLYDYTQPEPEDWGQNPPPENMLPPAPPEPPAPADASAPAEGAAVPPAEAAPADAAAPMSEATPTTGTATVTP